MASYQPQILPQYQLPSANDNASEAMNIFAKAMILKMDEAKKKAKEEKDLSAVQRMAKEYGLEPEISYDSEKGRRYKFKPKKAGPQGVSTGALKKSMVGMADSSPYAPMVGMEQQTLNTPQGDVSNANLVRDALMKKFAPGMNTEQLTSDVLGFPVNKQKSGSNLPLVIDPKTETVIANIQNEDDLNELINNAESYQREGVNVEAVKKYFKSNPIQKGFFQNMMGIFQ